MRTSVLAAALAAALPALAQQQANTVVITGNPLGGNELAQPASVLAGPGLVLRRGSSLGETLDGLPGVSSSYFGPNANRPVIRGQDGDRIRVLSNAGASLDASSLSFDHAVPIDPLVVERIEVLRGPAALLYGGSAVGGVVNAIDNRIPKAPLGAPGGAVEMRLGGAAAERGLSALLETGGNGFALHADAFSRRTSDLRVPAFDRPLDDGSSERRSRVANSASSAEGGALGASWVGTQGYLGASVDSYRNDYGIVAEEDVTIRMRRERMAVAGEWRPAAGWFSHLRFQAAHTDYQHQEVEGNGDIGTTFKTKGSDARFEAVHRALALGAAQVDGSVGAQFESASFSALGEEAFVPSTHTRQAAAFALARARFGEAFSLTGGARAERVQVDSDGDAPGAPAQFGSAQQRRFTPASASLGAVYELGAAWQLSGSWAYTERAPTSYELYAKGVHAATAAYEEGSLQQKLERGRNIDLALGWRSGVQHLKLGVFQSRFANYIALADTGTEFTNDAGESFPIFAFRGVRAKLQGVELEGGWRLLEGPRQLDLDGKLDWVRGSNLASGEPLPRLAPLRATLGLNLQQGAWTARAEVQHAARQNRVDATDSPTDGWTMLNLASSYTWALGEQREALLYAKLHNAGNVLAYSASTIGTVRPLAPLPGRALSVGLRFAF